MRCNSFISECLAQRGIKTVFALAGASYTHLLVELRNRGFHIVSSRHESGTIGAADGYSRVSNRPGIALIVADQGLANAVAGLAVAQQAESAVLVFATSLKLLVGADPKPEVELASTVCKDIYIATDAGALCDVLPTALDAAMQVPSGPTMLLTPPGMFTADIERSGPTEQESKPTPLHRKHELKKAAQWMESAQHPIIILGRGARQSPHRGAIGSMAREHGIPVLMNGMGRGVIEEDHDLGFSWPYAQLAAAEADVVLVLGSRLGIRFGHGRHPRFSRAVRFIHVDLNPEHLTQSPTGSLSVLADPGEFCRALDPLLREKLRGCGYQRQWLHDRLVARDQRVAELKNSEHERIHPVALLEQLEKRRADDSLLVADGADAANWLYATARIKRPAGFMEHYPMGAMGSCTAIAIGAAAAEREREVRQARHVILVTGDGAFGFMPMELQAAATEQLKLLVIIVNDGAWGTERHGQRREIGFEINTELGQLPYEKIAELIGATGIRIESPGQMEHSLDAAFKAKGTVIVNVLIDSEAGRELKENPDIRMITFDDINPETMR